MPEGDTIYRAATVLRRALAGRLISGFRSDVPQVTLAAARTPVLGRTVSAVEAKGKHLFIRFGDAPDDPVLRSHLGMQGSWHIYRPGEPWQRPERQARVVIETDRFVVPCFNAPTLELRTGRELAADPQLAALGPDAIADGFDAAEAARRLRARPDLAIGIAILDQRALAGVGNVFKSELLFIRRLSPFQRVAELDDAQLQDLVEEAHRQLVANRGGGARVTRPGAPRHQTLWIYGRAGKPCRVCGTIIRLRRQGDGGRTTYFCPSCQAAPPDRGRSAP
ncbi:MAG TPA: DNA-formamidopyrimidine glycosylase family protein [Candidatus Saccharimonadales bacterium]|nr:DNA-formamidopyrimidine glycosylase family protein [Candidatus Saccharimonadales bacterium]